MRAGQRGWGFLLLLSLLLSEWNAAAAGVRKRIGIDVILVLDGSKSMRTNDPQDLRKVGAREFIDLAREGDRIGIAEFGGQYRELAPLTVITAVSREELKRAVDQVTSDRDETDIGLALAEAYRQLEAQRDPNHNQYLLLLTDGWIDLNAGVAAEKASERRLREETLPAFKQQGWVVYTIGLSKEVDVQLMEDIVEATKKRVGKKVKGLHETTPTAREVPPVYAKIMAQMADWVTIDDERTPNVFKLDPAVDEKAILTVDKARGTQPTLTLPDGTTIGPKQAGQVPGLRWHTTPDYDILTLNHPPAGRYRFNLPGEGRTSGFAESKVWLRLYDLKRTVEPQEAVPLQAALLEGERTLTGSDPRLRGMQMRAQVTLPDGTGQDLTLVDNGQYGDEEAGDGVFTGYFTGTTGPGTYTVVARAHGKSFNRTSDPQTFRVGGKPSVWVKTDKDTYRRGESIKLTAGLTEEADWSSPRFRVTVFTPRAERKRLDLFDDGTHGDVPAQDGTYTNFFEDTEEGGAYTFIVRASGRTPQGQWVEVTRAHVVKVGLPGIVIKPRQVTFKDLTAKTEVRQTFKAQSALDYDEALLVELTDLEGMPPEALKMEIQQEGKVVKEISLPEASDVRFTVVLRTERRTTETGKPTTVAANLRFQAKNTFVFIEPEALPFTVTLVPLPPWWKFWLKLLGVLLALALLGWLIYLFTRPSLQGRLHITAPDGQEREVRLRNRGFWGLRRSLTLGSSKRCDLTLSDDPEVRPVQARLFRTRIANRTRLCVADLVTQRRHFLKDGDEITFGGHLLRYENFRDK